MNPLDDPYGLKEALGWLLMALVILAVAALGHALRRRQVAAPLRDQGSRSPQGIPQPCHVTGCPFLGRVCMERDRAGVTETIHVCHGHADEGSGRGWWLQELGWRRAA